MPADQHTFHGPAMCFNSEEECFAAYNAHKIAAGTAVIIRYEGPVGGPGMKELHRVTEIMKGIPGSAVITDGQARRVGRPFGRVPVPRGGRGRKHRPGQGRRHGQHRPEHELD